MRTRDWRPIAAAAAIALLAHGAVGFLLWNLSPAEPALKVQEGPAALLKVIPWKEPSPIVPPPAVSRPAPPREQEAPPDPPARAESPSAPTAEARSETEEPIVSNVPVTSPEPAAIEPAAASSLLEPERPTEPDYQAQTAVSVPPLVPGASLLARMKYPEKARRQEIQATVLLELFIDADGRIRKIEVLKDPGWGFAAEALKAFEGILCQPAQREGHAVAVRFRYPVRFSLR